MTAVSPLPLSRSARRWSAAALLAFSSIFLITPAAASAQERLCDTSFENCRVPLIDLIRNEKVGIDVAWWFMTDARYTTELINKWQQGVPIRVIIDPRANSSYPLNADRLKEIQDAGIPMRQKVSSGILHWKMMLFAGQQTVQFSAANYSPFGFVPTDPYRNYTDEVVYFSTVPSVVQSFMTKFDDLWTTTSGYSDYANVVTRMRNYPTYAKDPELNFPPKESFRNRSVQAYNRETQQIDAVMFRITDRQHTDALIAALGRGVRVRLLTDWGQYTWSERLWHAWNVDRLYKAGAEIRAAGESGDRPHVASRKGHWGTMHQKSTLLYSQGMTVFGSSNWTSPSTDSQEEHNYFTTRPVFFDYFRDQFERKWNNSNPLGAVETEPLELLPPDPQLLVSPANGATGQPESGVQLRWLAGVWTHVYDLYLGTEPNPPLVVADRELGPSMSGTDYKSLTVSNLQPGTTYYWRVVGKTMADVTRSSPVWTFTTAGTPTPPPPSGTLPEGWASQDIGAVGLAGSAAESGGTFTLHGAGADIWGTADGFHFAYRQLTGDGEIIARVSGVQGSHHWTKAGVMIRESVSAGSRHAMMLVSTARGLAFQRRVQTNGISTNTDGGAGTAPVWVRLVRTGTRIDAYRSSNGSSWALVGTETISMGSTVLVGLALTSHDTSSLATASFDNVLIAGGSGSPPPPPPALPSGWTSQDVGAVGQLGSATESGGTFTVKGAGADIWDTADGFHFAYRTISGDGQIVARVSSVQGSHHWTKAGVMIRESGTAGSRHAIMLVSTARGLAFQRRVQTGGISTHTDGGSGTAPVWVRLVRTGNRLDAYRSSNGTNWVFVGTDTIAMSSTVRVGLAVTSHDTSSLATAAFDDVQVTQGPASSEPPPSPLPDGWSSSDVGSVGAIGTAVESGGVFTVRGAGADIWGTADGFHFAYRPLTGDGRIVARVTRLDDTHRWAKAGVMIRESLSPGSRHAIMLVSPSMGMAFQRRGSTSGESVSTAGSAAGVPRWVAIERAGDVIHAFESANGNSWTLVGSDIIPMTEAVYVGLAVTSHVQGVLTTATFDAVSVQ
jgi:phosphatidylserine/phosphatidylglycerophosphate/cardiolipin synthase-like enzyme/regulation of enolase protein 1 (concanavalin A-like superfamily)